jgi:hypothetical protein
MQTEASSMSPDWTRPVWIGLLVAASLVLTLGFACAVPFAAFGAIAALTLTRRDALLAVGLVWLANQAAGFAVLHYPWTSDTFAWGAALLAVGLAATLAAELAVTRLHRLPSLAAASAAFLSAFVAYEGLLFIISTAVQSGVEDYDSAIVWRIFAINGMAFVGLLSASKLLAGWISSPRALGSARYF